MADKPDFTVELEFQPRGEEDAEKETAESLSAVAVDPVTRSLWVAADEFASVERLDPDGNGYRQQTEASFGLTHYIEAAVTDVAAKELLEKGRAKGRVELDLEGLAIDGDCLWIVASHALVRKSPERKEGETAADARARLLKRPKDASLRHVLGRIEFAEGDRRRLAGPTKAAWVPFDAVDSDLTRYIRAQKECEALRPFLDIPAKENGFDIEGIAVRDRRVFLGLRGPVLRGWAIILDLEVTGKAPLEFDRMSMHLLYLDGLGVRDLAFDGDDLLILAGPTMDLDGPVRVYAWPRALAAHEGELVERSGLRRVADIPFGDRLDHAEGMAVLETERGKRLLVVYDSPGKGHLPKGAKRTKYVADVFRLRP
jgi:hypothetical protein